MAAMDELLLVSCQLQNHVPLAGNVPVSSKNIFYYFLSYILLLFYLPLSNCTAIHWIKLWSVLMTIVFDWQASHSWEITFVIPSEPSQAKLNCFSNLVDGAIFRYRKKAIMFTKFISCFYAIIRVYISWMNFILHKSNVFMSLNNKYGLLSKALCMLYTVKCCIQYLLEKILRSCHSTSQCLSQESFPCF